MLTSPEKDTETYNCIPNQTCRDYTTMYEMKNALDGVNGRLNIAGENVS